MADRFIPRSEEVAEGLAGFLVAERVLLAQQYLAMGEWEQALSVCQVSTGVESGAALGVCEAAALYGLGRRAAALERIEGLLTARPDHVLPLSYKAQMLHRSGRTAEAVSVLSRIVERFPDYPGALAGLAGLLFPGPHYQNVLQRIHELLRPRTYLEVGVDEGATLRLAARCVHAVGIDPNVRTPRHPLPEVAEVFRESSDAFFAARTRQSLFGDLPLDLAFIDGMHWFEYALRDFVNVERWCRPESVVILHDCLPAAPAAAERERRSRFWAGDTWKALECLLAYRPDLNIATIPCFPSGLVIVTRLDPRSTVLTDSMGAIESAYGPLAYPHKPGVWPARYGVVDNSEAALARLLGR